MSKYILNKDNHINIKQSKYDNQENEVLHSGDIEDPMKILTHSAENKFVKTTIFVVIYDHVI